MRPQSKVAYHHGVLLGILLVSVLSYDEIPVSVVVLDVKLRHVDILQGPRHHLFELCEVPLPK